VKLIAGIGWRGSKTVNFIIYNIR